MQGFPSAYYNESHIQFRALVREFVEKEILPYVDEWDEGGYPKELHLKAYEYGIQGAIYPPEYGGTPPGPLISSKHQYRSFTLTSLPYTPPNPPSTPSRLRRLS